jgi:ubiquinone/menaquinone biosynthesis C-methylase UbiE
MPSVHDPLVRFSFPLAVGENEAQSRERYFARIALERIVPRAGGPVRVLEVGVGTGSNVPLIREKLRQRLPSGLPVEIWGVDLSMGMLRWLEKRLRFLDDRETRYLAVDAHRLPFPNGFFDRVFHVGAINGYRDPATALAEMARVARPGTPIVVVDERLDPGQRHGLLQRLFFKMMTIYDKNPHAPVEHLPPGASNVQVDQLGRFFYCLTFTMTPAIRRRAQVSSSQGSSSKNGGFAHGARPSPARPTPLASKRRRNVTARAGSR